MSRCGGRCCRCSPTTSFYVGPWVLSGLVGYRDDIVIAEMQASIGDGFDRPSWMGIWLMVGMVASILLADLFIVENFPVYTKLDVASAFGAAERRAREMPARPRPPRSMPVGR